jgi:hypothetical protein
MVPETEIGALPFAEMVRGAMTGLEGCHPNPDPGLSEKPAVVLPVEATIEPMTWGYDPSEVLRWESGSKPPLESTGPARIVGPRDVSFRPPRFRGVDCQAITNSGGLPIVVLERGESSLPAGIPDEGNSRALLQVGPDSPPDILVVAAQLGWTPLPPRVAEPAPSKASHSVSTQVPQQPLSEQRVRRIITAAPSPGPEVGPRPDSTLFQRTDPGVPSPPSIHERPRRVEVSEGSATLLSGAFSTEFRSVSAEGNLQMPEVQNPSKLGFAPTDQVVGRWERVPSRPDSPGRGTASSWSRASSISRISSANGQDFVPDPDPMMSAADPIPHGSPGTPNRSSPGVFLKIDPTVDDPVVRTPRTSWSTRKPMGGAVDEIVPSGAALPRRWASSGEGRWLAKVNIPSGAEPFGSIQWPVHEPDQVEVTSSQGRGVFWETAESEPPLPAAGADIPELPAFTGSPVMEPGVTPEKNSGPDSRFETAVARLPESERPEEVEVSRSLLSLPASEPARIAREVPGERSTSRQWPHLPSQESTPRNPDETSSKRPFSEGIPAISAGYPLLENPPQRPAGMTFASGPEMASDRFQSSVPQAGPHGEGGVPVPLDSSEVSVVTDRFTASIGLPTVVLGTGESHGRIETMPTPVTGELSQLPAGRSASRLADQLSGEVVLLHRLRTASMTAVLRPDAGSELRVDLRRRSGRIEIRATVERGDSHAIAEGWAELQQRMSSQGILLLPLERDTSRPPSAITPKAFAESGNDTQGENLPHSGGRGGHSQPSRDPEVSSAWPASDANPHPDPVRSSTAARRGSGHHRLLESWA